MAAPLYASGPNVALREVAAPSRPTDEELVHRLRRGDGWAKEALYRRYFSLVWGTAVRLLRSRNDAEDVVQDTFATALDQIGDLREPGAVGGWLVQITVRLVHRRFRRRKLLRLLGLDQSTDDATLSRLAQPGLGAEARAELAVLDGVLAELSDVQRVAWMLRHVEGFSLEEVASASGCSLATVKRRLQAADERVRDHVQLDKVSHD